METSLENEYKISKKVFSEWAKRPITKDFFTYLWVGLAVLIIALAVIARVYNNIFFITFYLFLELFCVYRIFFRKKLILAKQFQNIALNQGKNEWNRTIKISDKIIMIDGNITAEYEWSQVKELIIDKDYFILLMGKSLGIRIDKSGFTKGTCETFIDNITQEHGTIPVRTRK